MRSLLTALFTCLLVAVLGGCATPMSALDPPPRWCMAKPKPLPVLKEGDDLIQRHAALRRQASRHSSRLRCLQRYGRAVSPLK